MLFIFYDLPSDFPISLDHRRVYSIDRLLTSLFKSCTYIQQQSTIFRIIVCSYYFFFVHLIINHFL